MLISLAIAIVSLAMAIGFYNGSLDWLLIYYGCAPTKKKSRMPGEKILSIASTIMFIIAMLAGLNIGFFMMRMELLAYGVYVVMAILFLVMIIWTYKLTKDT